MEPLRITVRVDGPISFAHPIHLDSLLAKKVCERDGIDDAHSESEMRDIDIPVQRSECGRYHLATVGYSKTAANDLEHVNRMFPAQRAVHRSRMKTINPSGGMTKNFRIPVHVQHLDRGQLTWWCIGDAEAILELLTGALYLGRGRARGTGKVDLWRGFWTVEPCEPWPGFPVLSADGEAMRNLPLDTSGLKTFDYAETRVTFPYWAPWGRAEAATPVMS
jgi:hypothetical protein